MIAAVTVMFIPSPAAQAAGKTVVDPDTTNAWSDIAASSTNTQNIGRIWTDKSVFDDDYTFSGSTGGQTVSKGDSDFLVGLSALSSTSNLKTTTTTTTPLDIVLVLDQSGSMGDSFGGWGSGSRRAALQEAAKNFINATEESNQGLDQSQQHRISIVTFDSDSRVSRGWTYVSGNGADQLRSTVDGLRASGATRVDRGMDDANGQLNSARQGAMKVVIVFTDGDPTSGSSFENEVAADAINTAHTIKQDKGATVYTIGIFSGANPNTDNKANNYMNAMSSNYPTATADGDNGGWYGNGAYFNITWGDGSRNDGYYKSATNSEELNKVFEEISEDITTNAGSGSPIEEVTHEGALNPGTLSFTDELGSYMEVSGDTMTVVYGDRMFTSTSKTTAGNDDTYHFKGTVAGNAVYKEADLADLTVKVTHDDALAAGDNVTVQIPASLIPMRNYDVDTDAKTMTVSAAYPIRLFFGVSVKADAEKAIEQGSGDVYDAIVETNKTDDGKVAFYSNLYNSGSGDTTATFTPSDGNKFYYYTQDTDLYTDKACTQRATTQNIGSHNTLYYSEPYWQITSGRNAQEVTRGIAIDRDGQDWNKMTPDGQGNYYIPDGTQRLDRPATLNSDKVDENGKPANNTGTATTVLTPSWEGTGVTQRLGNNGKITYDLPGELEIKKSVDWGNASDDTKQNSFEFTVNFNGDEKLNGNFAYDVYESGEEPVVSDATVTDGGTITLKDGQRAVIKGLPAGTTFTVTETGSNENGFTTTDTVTADPNNDTTDGIANGTIVGGSRQSVSFQNNYKADEPVKLSTKTNLKVKKNLTGRDWRASDEFSFQITQIDNGAPTVQMEDPTKVEITQQTDQQTASFGDITFSESGQYRFRVEELSDADQGITPIAGIDYSGAIYRVTVDVADAGQGKLEITSVLIEQMTNDDGGQGSGEVQGDTMAFENRYVVGRASETLQGTKVYENETGSNPIDAGKFSFQLEALGGYETGTVTGEAQPGDYTIAADSDAMPKPAGMTGTTLETGNVGDMFQFPTIYFDGNDVGKTFEYRITELPHQYQGAAEPGMIYDEETSYVVKIVVTEEQDPDSTEPKIVIMAEPSLQPSDITFTNKYEPAAAELTGDDAIHGTKTLEGRQMKEGETFYFQLSALNDNAKTVLSAPETVKVTDQNSMDFTFAGMTFTKVGTYTFQVNEVADDNGTETTNANGMTFDTNIATVTVTVTDGNDSDDPAGHGKLLASVSYSNDKHSNVTDHAQFTNVYKANMNYGAGGAGGIAVTKTMVDRTMDAGDYNFTLTGTGPDGEITETFENTAAAANGTVTMKQLQNLTFDEQDAEKTFTFTVDEADPTDENRLPGVEYDQSQYRVDITVHDNHDGTMYTETTVTKIKNADGTEANDVVVGKLDSSTAQGKVPTFGFTNTYKPTEASLDGDTALKVTKKVTGAPSAADYTFTLTAQETPDGSVANIGGLTDGKLTVSTNGVINQDATDNTDDDTQTVSFGKLTFSKPGTYTFTAQENQPDADDGWTFDDADNDNATDVHNVTVEVGDLNEDGEYDGALHIKSVTPQGPTVITNSYKADPVIVGGDGAQQKITVQKSVTGADSTADFTFKIEPVTDDDHSEQWWRDRVKATEGFSPELTISGVTQELDVTKAFAGIQFNAVGEYKFNVTEVGAAEFNEGADRKGWTYDEHTATVTVKVTDEGNDGQLDAEVVYDNTSATTTADQGVNNAASFTNKYEAGSTTLTGSSTTFNGSKTVTGRDWLDGESFGFTMKPVEQEGVDWSSVTYKADDSSEPVAVGENIATATENGDKTVPFWFPGSYTFTKAGTYTFNVTETQHNSKALPQDDTNGMTYDHHTGVITVTVEDNGEGQLVATPKSEKMTFENKYTPTPVVYGDDASEILGGNKTVEDHSGSYTMADDQFTFMMRAQNADNPMPEGLQVAQDDQGRPIVSTTNKNTDTQNNKATFDFGEITFTKAGTYQYNIYENETNMPAGVSAQDSGRTYTITFKVTENTATGELTVDASAVLIGSGDQENAPVQLNEINFVNEYDATATRGSTQIFKTLEGRNWQQGDTFTFDVSMKVDGVAADEMPTFNFDNTGTTVNDFKSEAGKLSYNVTITPSTSATGNTYAFSTGTATYTHEGTYVYTITERDVDSSVVNVTKDAAVYTVTVEVKNVNNALQRTVTISRDGQPYTETGRVDFTNTYTPTASEGVPTDFALQKTFTGHEWTNDYAFEFKLSPVDGAPMPKEDPDAGVTIDDEGNAHKTISAPTGDSTDTATFDFGAISYDKAGTYNYTVTEHSTTTGNGITYDGHTAHVTVTVTEGKDDAGTLTGQLVATATVTDGTFTNEYNAEQHYTGNIGLDITKQVTNHAMSDGQFSFTITAADEASAKKLGIQDGTTATVESAQAAAGTATSVKSNPFEAVVFDETDDGKTFTYTIKENGTTGEGDYKNYVLDDSTYTVQIKPVDNGDGTMTVTTQVSDGAGYTEMTTDQRATVPFVNSYQADPTTVGAEGAATIEGTKTLKNDILADGQFTFQVKSGDVVVATGTNAANGTITFDDITYTTENLAAAATSEGSPEVGKTAGAPQVTDEGTVYTFNYTVSEVEPAADSGVTASTAAQSITVTVTDDGNGTLTPEVTYGDGDPLAFENVYGGDAKFALDIAGTKEIVGAQDGLNVPQLEADDYAFTIVGNPAQDGTPAPMPAATTVANDASGNVTFKDIVYTMENTFGSAPATGIATLTAGRTQVFTYTISESGSVDGVTNEQGTKTVEVTVTDLGGGQLKAEVTSDKTAEGTDFTFTNVYDVKPTTSSLTGKGGFAITKKLTSDTGRKLAKDEFSFQLTSGDTVVATASNDADGTVSFDGIEFTKPGTYDYVLSEVNDGKPGVDYDATSYNVTATATDNGDGTLTVTWDMPQAVDDAVTFTNVYDPADATVTLGAGKTFAGADLKDAQFTFQLTGADESTPMPEGAKDGVSTATNDENGSVVFDTIAYGKPGTYKYTVSEVNDEQDGVTYDDTTYEVTVTVTDDTATGTLKAAVSYGDADAMVFSNQYKKPVEPAKPTIPKTGIDVIIPGVAGLVLLLGAGGVYAFKRRKRS